MKIVDELSDGAGASAFYRPGSVNVKTQAGLLTKSRFWHLIVARKKLTDRDMM